MSLRQAALKIAANLPQGDPTRRKLLALLRQAATPEERAAEAMMDWAFDFDKALREMIKRLETFQRATKDRGFQKTNGKALDIIKRFEKEWGDYTGLDSGSGSGPDATWSGIVSELLD